MIPGAPTCTTKGSNCYRVFALLGTLFTALLLGGCEGQPIKADILNSEDVLFESTEKVIYEEKFPDDWVYGAIITPDEISIQEVLEKIPNAEMVETVVLLSAYNAPPRQEGTPATSLTYNEPGVLSELNIQFDTETIFKLQESNFVKIAAHPVAKESGWNRPYMWVMSHQFPNAKFVLISQSHTDTDQESTLLASALKSYLPKKSTVIALSRSIDQPNSSIREFQDSFTHQTVTQSEDSQYFELPLYNKPAVATVGHYLRRKQARKPLHFSLNGNRINALFQQGFPPDVPRSAHLVFFGDIMLGRYVRVLMDAHGLNYPFHNIDRSYLQSNDLLIANLEGPVTTEAVQHADGMNFGFFPDTAPLLKNWHFDLLSMANNHAFDKGADAWRESLNLLQEQYITAFGHPNDIVEESVAYRKIGPHRFAFLGLEDVNSKMKTADSVAIIERLSKEGFKVIVFPHWGLEYMHHPSKVQRHAAYQFIDAGAFAVIGHHPHVEQSYENYKGRPIFYSLGNAIFDQYWSADTQLGLSLSMIVTETDLTVYLIPIKLPKSQMQLMNSEEASRFLERFATYGAHSEEEKQQIKSGKIIIPLAAGTP